MNNTSPKIKYFLYARKSSESEDRQVQSIDDQISRIEQLAQDFNLNLTKPYFTEAKSAKKPNNRPKFDELLECIENGEANGIVCWQINRLSRNPIDSARIQWMLQQGVLQSIQTIDRQYKPEDNVLLFSVESGMANQFVLDLSKNVKRGMQSKREKGWLPHIAPAGYLNDVVNHTIIKDPDRFPLLRRAWEYMLTGNYNPTQITALLNDEWGFRTVKLKRIGGTPLSISGLYRIFNSLFYAGILTDPQGNEYQGKHMPMITLEEFDHVQRLLKKRGKPRPKTHEFAFTGCIQCGECGCRITAENKQKHIKSTGKIKTYTYYHCTKRKRGVKCSQKSISKEKLEKQIEQEILACKILPEFKDWALDILSQRNDREIDDRTRVYETQHKNLTETQKQLDELTRMRYRQLIDDEQFIKESGFLKKEITRLKGRLRETENRAERWLELTENTFKFATYAHAHFLKGDLKKKKEILLGLGSNFIFKDEKLTLQANELLEPIIRQYPALEKKYLRLEPTKNRLIKTKNSALDAIICEWQGC